MLQLKNFKNFNIEKRIHAARKSFVHLDNRIRRLQQAVYQYEFLYNSIQESIRNLRREKRQLERFVKEFKNNDERYLMIKEIVKEKINDIIMNNSNLSTSLLSTSGYSLGDNPKKDFLIKRIINNKDINSNILVKDNYKNNTIEKSDDYYRNILEKGWRIYNNLLTRL